MRRFDRREFLEMASGLAGIALLQASCVGASPAETVRPAAGGPRVGGRLVAAITEEPDTLDPQRTATAVTGAIMRVAGDTLITRDFSGNYVPALAESWQVSDDGLVWKFRLKEGVRFHNGEAVTADAVKASIERALDPNTRSPIAGSIFAQVERVDVTDSLNFTIRLKEPFAPFLENLADPRTVIVSARAAAQLGDEFGRRPVLTGPWQIQEWRSGDRIVLTRNPD